MTRYRLGIEYDGTGMVGWQMQADGCSVQGALYDAIRSISGEDYIPRGAGRTDAGVHASGQVAHIELQRKPWSEYRLGQALNAHLRAHHIAITSVHQVPDDFDARFSARRRHYLYRVLNRLAPPALERNRVWPVHQVLDADRMQQAAQIFIGRHDFTTFRAAQCQAASPVKTLDHFMVIRRGDLIECRISARSFLHHQVRSLVGALKWVGQGKWGRDDLHRALQAADRSTCPPVAPAAGLYLAGVDYPDGWSSLPASQLPLF